MIFLTSTLAFSQISQDTDYRRLSLTVSGGASLGDMNNGNYFMSSSFSVNTEETPTYGLGVQYALTPTWSFELGYRRAQVRGISKAFEANINQVALKSIFNLNQLLSLNQITPRLNPFLSAGLGYDMYDYEGSDANFSSHNTSYNAGFGAAFKLTNTFDLFGHYEYHFGSNALDNETKGYGADMLNTVTAGVRINFGKKEAKLASWREPAVDVRRTEYERMLTQAKMADDLQEKIERMEQQHSEREKQLAEQVEEKEAKNDSLAARISQMDNLINNLRNTLAEVKAETKSADVDSETGLGEALPRGFYVQIFAATRLDVAQDLRNKTIENVRDVLADAEEKIFIIQRKEYYEVFVGAFSSFSQAREVEQTMKKLQEDAYVISFPRPESLSEDFEGIKIINENGSEISMSN
ncbi:MAG: outer membrane beta-barrel protein [Balneolaceae bacterium]|nr:outer membrane beta-barrel protein [Balneolaceae bacterium]